MVLRAAPWWGALSLACTPPGEAAETGVLADETGEGETTDAGETTEAATSVPTTGGGEPSIPCPLIEPLYDLDGDGQWDTDLDSQDDVALFAGCTDVTGSLQIFGDVTDLKPLASLRRIHGSLQISNIEGTLDPAWALLSLEGLEGLESVRGLDLSYLVVTSLQPFAGIKELPGGLQLRQLSELESLADLHDLEHIGGPLTIKDSAKLTDLQALAGVTGMTGDLLIEGLPMLESLEGLHNIQHIGGRLAVDDCPVLADLDGLRGLQRIDDRMHVRGLPITSLHGLEALTMVGEPSAKAALVTLGDLPQLTSLAGLAIEWHDAHQVWIYRTRISDIDALAGASELYNLWLTENDELIDLAGLESLVVVHDTLSLGGNTNLVDLGALGSLKSVGGLTLTDTALTDLALPALQKVGDLRITLNPQLVALSGLDGLTSLGSLVLEHNPALVTLPDLSALMQVEGDLVLRSNDALTTVAELANVTDVGGRLVVVLHKELLQTEAVAWSETITVVGARKIVRNKGDLSPPADPCPWFDDGQCDEEGGVCAPGTDPWDCRD